MTLIQTHLEKNHHLSEAEIFQSYLDFFVSSVKDEVQSLKEVYDQKASDKNLLFYTIAFNYYQIDKKEFEMRIQ